MSGVAEPNWRSTFQPDRDPKHLESLRNAFLAQRAQLALEALKRCNELLWAARLEPVGHDLLNLLSRELPANALVLDDPVFAIWLRFFHRAMANGRYEESVVHLFKLQSVLEDVERRLTKHAEAYVPGSVIAVERKRLNPYVMAATPPSYDFTRMVEGAPIVGHPIEMQADLLGLALKSIGEAWPELKDQVIEFVRIIGYLPDATFRSCSAARYSGIVYLGNMDESVLDLEESLVHETGHQVLYRLGEMRKLTRPNTPVEATYVLPWSSSRRDLFGFLHAYYIYALLTKYYWRRAALGDRYGIECQQRAILILAGLLIATPTLKSDPNLSDQGRIIVDELSGEVEKLRDDMRAKLNG